MRKIPMYLLVALVIMLNIKNISAEEIGCRANHDWRYISLNKKLDNSKLIMAKFLSSQNEIGFCLEPEVEFLSCSEYDFSSYSSDQLLKIAQIIDAYNHLGASDDLYIAAQLMIWETLGKPQTLNGDNGYNYRRNEIESFIANNPKSKVPNLPNSFEIDLDKEYQLDDLNKVISSNYIIKGDGFSDLKIKDNQIIFKATDLYPVIKTIKLEPKVNINSYLTQNSLLYSSDTSQNILKMKTNLPEYFHPVNIKVKHKTGDLIVNKYNEWGEYINGEATFQIFKAILREDKFEIGDEILTESNDYWTTKNGILNIQDILVPGYYYLKERTCDGFEINNAYILFEITENETTSFNFYNANQDVLLSINKVDRDDNTISDTHFSIYDISKTIDNDKEETIYPKDNDFYTGLNDNQQFKGDSYYSQEIIYLLNKDKFVNIKEFLFEDEEISRPIKLKLSHDRVVSQVNPNQIKGIKTGFVDFEIVPDNYPELYLRYIDDCFEIFDEELNDITNDFEIAYKDEIYYISSNNDFNDIKMTINHDEIEEYIDIRQYIFDKSDDQVIKKGRIYVMDDMDKDYDVKKGILLYQGYNDNQKLQIQNPYNHNLYLDNYQINIYNSENVNVLSCLSDDMGLVDISRLDDGIYYYMINDTKLYFEVKTSDTFIYRGLKRNREYLICESRPNKAYDYISSPCQYLNTNQLDKEIYEIEFINDIRKIELLFKKTNLSKRITLNNSIFEVTLTDGENVKNIKYISGGIIFQANPQDKYLYIKNLEDDEVRELVIDHQEIIIKDLKEGDYLLASSENKLKDSSELIWRPYSVIKGSFIIKDVPYNTIVKLTEISAPDGYLINHSIIDIAIDLDYEDSILETIITNRPIEVVNTACLKNSESL